MIRPLLLALLVALGHRLVPAILDALPGIGHGFAAGAVLMACGGALAADSLRGRRP